MLLVILVPTQLCKVVSLCTMCRVHLSLNTYQLKGTLLCCEQAIILSLVHKASVSHNRNPEHFKSLSFLNVHVNTLIIFTVTFSILTVTLNPLPFGSCLALIFTHFPLGTVMWDMFPIIRIMTNVGDRR